jgi:hypothetical protein
MTGNILGGQGAGENLFTQEQHEEDDLFGECFMGK